MQRQITRGAAANAGLIFHIFAQDSASTTGAGKASVAFGSWSCRYIRNGEAISGAITPEDITTIGTYAAPTANTNIRIKAVDNTNMIGIYEVQIHADWVNTTNSCQSLTIYLTASGVAVLPVQIQLVAFNPQDTVRLGLTALPNAAADAAGGLPVSDAGGLDLDAILADTADMQPKLGTPAGVSMSADIAAIEAQTDDIGAAGAGLTAVPWNAAWDAEVQSEVQDAIDATLPDSIPADGTRPSLGQAAYMIAQFLLDRAVSGTTVTVRKVDGTTALLTCTLDDGTTPTSITRAT